MVEHLKHSASRYLNSKWRTIGVLLFVAILFGFLGYKNFEIKYQDRFYPGVFIGGESVGGQTYSAVLDHFKEKVGELEKNGLSTSFTISRGIQKANIPVSVAGITPDNSVEYFSLNDLENNIQVAYKWGHGTSPLLNLKERTTLLFTKKDFNFRNSLNREAVDSFLEDAVYNLQKKSSPATFSFANNKIFISKEVKGETIDRDGVLNILEKKLLRLDITPTAFAANQDVPIVTEKNLEPFIDFVDKFAKEKNLVFQYKGHEWKVAGTKLVTWLTINDKNSISIDATKLGSYLDSTVAKLVDNPPQNSRFEMQGGKITETVPGKSGNTIDMDDVIRKVDQLFIDTNAGVKIKTFYVPIETIEVLPKVTKETVEKYRILDLVGEIRTSFDGSTRDREHNIKIGVATINGILIPPDTEFSTVSSIGPVTEKEGYVKEMVIKENKTTKEFGGGLCQIATTLFRLALNAGLPITERQNHRFVVHYYDPPGLDATIYGPHPDLRFINDTGNYLLLQARVENKQVIMELYGQKDGRISEISKATLYNKIPAPPTKYTYSSDLTIGQTKCTEEPHSGVTTDVLYTVKYANGTVNDKNFHSIYQPWQKVCIIGTTLPNPI